MLPEEPRAAIAAIPYLVDVEPRDSLVMLGLDADGSLRYGAAFPAHAERPLDEPLLESSLWGDDIRYGAIVAFTELPTIDLSPVVDAWGHRDRTALQALWAGPARWRSYLCRGGLCCTPRGHRYAARAVGHDDFDPFASGGRPTPLWRQHRWDDWQQAIIDIARGFTVERATIELLARSLHDIPVRDALLAHSVSLTTQERTALCRLLDDIMMRGVLGVTVPAYTCAAAMRYLDGDLDAAQRRVEEILDAEEYSLARLLANGLSMHAPASLLARSFAHYSPQQLLAA